MTLLDFCFGLLFKGTGLGDRLDSSCLVTTSKLGSGSGGGGRFKICLGAVVAGRTVAGGGGGVGGRVGENFFENFCFLGFLEAFGPFLLGPPFFFN